MPSNSPLYKPSRIFRASSECPTSSKASVASFPVKEAGTSGEGLGSSVSLLVGEGAPNQEWPGRGKNGERTSFADDDLVSCSRSNSKSARVRLLSHVSTEQFVKGKAASEGVPAQTRFDDRRSRTYLPGARP